MKDEGLTPTGTFKARRRGPSGCPGRPELGGAGG